MSLPVFYSANIDNESMPLDEDTSKHIVQVLRMRNNEQIELTDGKGKIVTAKIVDDHKKKVVVEVQGTRYREQERNRNTIAISLIKNANRFEWFLEKATEIGITTIIPMLCERTERQHFRTDRMQSILVSAMLQSRQSWLPELSEPVPFKRVVETSHHQQKFIAHCIEEEKRNLADLVNESLSTKIILVGPEGDFTNEEIEYALSHHFTAASLGNTRLRAETAGVVAAAILKLG